LHARAIPARGGKHQFDLFSAAVRDPNRLSETLARLEAILGPERIGVPKPLPTHRPDAFEVEPFDPAAEPEIVTGPEPMTGLVLRRFRPRVHVQVDLGEGGAEDSDETVYDATGLFRRTDLNVKEGYLPVSLSRSPQTAGKPACRPVGSKRQNESTLLVRETDPVFDEGSFSAEKSSTGFSTREADGGPSGHGLKNPCYVRGTGPFSGAVVECRGPWRFSGGWWDAVAMVSTETDRGKWKREEWDVALESGGLFRLVRDRREWFLEGVYG
ncbi:MAG: hypothetical protein HKN23_12195, partial [Verrucomicrobiales bacterium]|nr:hypothetical protein [Verrucomicrobiales bacterium]